MSARHEIESKQTNNRFNHSLGLIRMSLLSFVGLVMCFIVFHSDFSFPPLWQSLRLQMDHDITSSTVETYPESFGREKPESKYIKFMFSSRFLPERNE